MSLLQMSFSGAIMILAIMGIRALAIHKLPKNFFILLWEIVLLRLLIPFSIPSIYSVYSWLGKDMLEKGSGVIKNALPQMQVGNLQLPMTEEPISFIAGGAEMAQNEMPPISGAAILWGIGMLLCAAFFAIAYARCYLEFRTSLPVQNEYAVKWLEGHRLRRRIQIRQSDRITAPLTYGLLKPVILMPKKIDWENGQQLQYILMHEYVHICRFDLAVKLVAVVALCIHWYNPIVWILYILFNRDIELACDEQVVKRLGDGAKGGYARALISMEEKKSGFMPLCNNFSKNAIEERITAIMKGKKATVGAIILCVTMGIGILVVFATSAEDKMDAVNDEIGIIMKGIDVPDVVLEASKERVEWFYNRYNEDEEEYSNWRIESIEHVYTYEDLNGMTLLIYLHNYRFYAEHPENLILAGGMSVDEEGWVVPDYPNSHYLVFKQEGNELTYMLPLFENDCWPGDELFTNDLKRRLEDFGAQNYEILN